MMMTTRGALATHHQAVGLRPPLFPSSSQRNNNGEGFTTTKFWGRRQKRKAMMRVEAAAASSSSKNFIDKENETQGQNKDKQVRTFYTFKPGETVEMLSEYVGVDVEALKALNPGVDLDFVFPGDRVVVHVERQREREQKEVKDEGVREKVAAVVDSQGNTRQRDNNNTDKNQERRLNKEKEKRAARMEEERNERRRREKEEKLLKKAEKEQRQQQKKMKKQVQLQATKRAAPVFNAGAAMFVASVPVLAISTRLGFFNPVLDTFGKVKAMLASSSDAREQSSSMRDEASSSSSSSSSSEDGEKRERGEVLLRSSALAFARERDLVRVGLGVSVRVWVIVFRVRDEFVVGRRKCFGEFKVRGGRDWTTERRVAPSRERLVERRREKSHGEFSDVSKARRYVCGVVWKK
mmetsp:Transcript_558/g.1994  ORF Transcript_558/g.1994 Transcript_558/m.1994 type:complete len:408 (-) Transcript_558:954-2177(-)